MYQFNYHTPNSLADAQQLMSEAADGVYLSGGMTLIPTMKARLAAPSDVIDLSGVAELSGISSSGGTLSIGAMTRHADVAGSDVIPALAELAGQIGDAQVRNRGTIGGSLANSDPAADYPAAVVGLGATIHTTSRSIAGDDFFTGLFETALEEGEIITKVEFPIPAKAAYAKFPNPASRYAVAGVMVADVDGSIRVGVTGAAACAFRLTAFEEALAGEFSQAAVDGLDVDDSTFNADIHASAEYRANLVKVMAQRAIARIS